MQTINTDHEADIVLFSPYVQKSAVCQSERAAWRQGYAAGRDNLDAADWVMRQLCPYPLSLDGSPLTGAAIAWIEGFSWAQLCLVDDDGDIRDMTPTERAGYEALFGGLLDSEVDAILERGQS
jgi:hypothetical protein